MLNREMTQAPTLPAAKRGEPTLFKALMVTPFYAKDQHASFGKHVLTPALTFSTLAGATPAHWQLEFWDENHLQGPPPQKSVPEVVAITVHLTFAKRAYQLARWFKQRGSTVVMGGLHVEACADEVAAHADAIATGNGTITWPQILQDIEQGRLKKRYHGEWDKFCQEPLPNRTILPSWGYLTPLSLVATRGCHNRCDFCYLSTGSRQRYQTLEVEQVVRQFSESGAPYGVFVDNNLGSNRRFLRQLCRALSPLDRIWGAAVSIDVTDDESLIREMALGGCTGVFIGFESLNDDNLSGAGKRSPKAQDYARRVAMLHRYGIQVNGSFVLGFDHDRPDVFQKTVRWVEDNRLECATYHILTPYPGTPFFQRMEQEGRLLHRDWDLYDTGHCVFSPKHMSPQQLEQGYAWMYKRTFSTASILKRRPTNAAAIPPYLAMAWLYKRSNWLWPGLIKNRLVHKMWQPLVQLSRQRHVKFRAGLVDIQPGCSAQPAAVVL